MQIMKHTHIHKQLKERAFCRLGLCEGEMRPQTSFLFQFKHTQGHETNMTRRGDKQYIQRRDEVIRRQRSNLRACPVRHNEMEWIVINNNEPNCARSLNKTRPGSLLPPSFLNHTKVYTLKAVVMSTHRTHWAGLTIYLRGSLSGIDTAYRTCLVRILALGMFSSGRHTCSISLPLFRSILQFPRLCLYH